MSQKDKQVLKIFEVNFDVYGRIEDCHIDIHDEKQTTDTHNFPFVQDVLFYTL